jgi:hypothetical protein
MFDKDGKLANHGADTLKHAVEDLHARLAKLEKAKGEAPAEKTE